MKHLQFQGRVALSEAQRFTVMHLPRLLGQGVPRDHLPQLLAHYGHGSVDAEKLQEDPTWARRQVLEAACDTPDVTTMLAESGAPSRMIDDVQAFGDLIAGCEKPLLLDRCAADDSRGGFHIAYFLPEAGVGVGAHDDFYGGIMLHGNSGNGRLRVAPRIVRQVCTNGMTQVTDEVGRDCAYWRDPDGRVRGDMGLALQAGLTRAAVGDVVQRLAALAEIPATDPVAALAEKGVRVPHEAHARVRRVFERDAGRSLYGALNALTETARDASTVAERVRLEHAAGRSVLVERPVPVQSHRVPSRVGTV